MKKQNLLRFPGHKKEGRPSVMNDMARLSANNKELLAQIQHLSTILWLALKQNGELFVDAADLKDWPANRAVRGQKIEGTEKVVWTAAEDVVPTPS